ncbi:hypothetical protein Taro_004153 [Colocasia esculenta]|uniref:Ubiquitin-like protease family profile domain-containing protein n=1 Tax=Colocasia esculenta TaxID=4460 RepID=A0A843TQW2_COLES|nr:hypothetical protein [Colocasia esculenta]
MKLAPVRARADCAPPCKSEKMQSKVVIKKMDWSWMDKPKHSKKYLDGVDLLIDFACGWLCAKQSSGEERHAAFLLLLPSQQRRSEGGAAAAPGTDSSGGARNRQRRRRREEAAAAALGTGSNGGEGRPTAASSNSNAGEQGRPATSTWATKGAGRESLMQRSQPQQVEGGRQRPLFTCRPEQRLLPVGQGRKRSVEYVEPIEGEDDKSQNVIKTSKSSGPIASADILKAKKKDFYLWSILSAEHLKNNDYWDYLRFPYYKSNTSQRKKMLTWVKDKEVFLKKYSFVPICMWGHWSLVILCHEEEDDLPFIILLDSLHSIDPTKFVRLIQRLIPQQTNGTKCGFFVLYYIYHFIQNDPASFSLDDYPSFLTCDWFTRAEFEKFVDDLILRIEVQEVVVEISKKKHRGPTNLSFVHGLDNGKRIVVQINELGQPVGEGGHSLQLVLETIARLGDKMSIDAPTWKAMSATHKDDVWEYVQRYSDINKKSKSHCAGTKSFVDINEEEIKLQNVKITQPSSSSSSSIATTYDIYSQVFEKDRPG